MKFDKIVEGVLAEDTSKSAMKLLKQLHKILSKESGVKVKPITTDKEFGDSGFDFEANGDLHQVSADVEGGNHLVYYVGDDDRPGEIHSLKPDDDEYQYFRDEIGI